MKMFILSFILLVTNFSSIGQYEPLKNIPFEEGGYTILGTFVESDPNSLQDSLGEFFIEDIELINELKSLWVFDQEAPFYACGYHYGILICKDGKEIESFAVNLNCNTLCNGIDCYNFDNEKLRFLYGKTSKVVVEEKETSIQEGRNYLDSIKNDANLIYFRPPVWMNYEGEFHFTYHYPEGTEEYYPQFEKKINSHLLQYTTDSVLAKIERQIRKTYPDEMFELYDHGGSIDEILFTVRSNKSLYNKFELFPLEEREYWEYFKPRFEVYWKKRIYAPVEHTKRKKYNHQKPVETTSSYTNSIFIFSWILLIVGMFVIAGIIQPKS